MIAEFHKSRTLPAVTLYLRRVYFYGPVVRWAALTFKTFVHIIYVKWDCGDVCSHCCPRDPKEQRFTASTSDYTEADLMTNLQDYGLGPDENDNNGIYEQQQPIVDIPFEKVVKAYDAYKARAEAMQQMVGSGAATAAVTEFLKRHHPTVRVVGAFSPRFLDQEAWPDYSETIVASKEHIYNILSSHDFDKTYKRLTPTSDTLLSVVFGALARSRLPVTELNLQFELKRPFSWSRDVSGWKELDLSDLTVLKIVAAGFPPDDYAAEMPALLGLPLFKKVSAARLRSFHFGLANVEYLSNRCLPLWNAGPELLRTLQVVCLREIELPGSPRLSACLEKLVSLRHLRFTDCYAPPWPALVIKWKPFWKLLRGMASRVRIVMECLQVWLPKKEGVFGLTASALFDPSGEAWMGPPPGWAYETEIEAFKELGDYISGRSEQLTCTEPSKRERCGEVYRSNIDTQARLLSYYPKRLA